MKTGRSFLLPAFLLLAAFACAEGTSSWTQSSYDEFSRGTAKGVAIRSNGTLELAPAFTPVFTSPSTFIWAMAAAEDGSVYLAAGQPARVYRVTPDGKAAIVFEPKELQVQALAVSGNVIYAATSPDGKVYKIERKAAAANQKEPAKAAAGQTPAATSAQAAPASAAASAEAAKENAEPVVPVDASFQASVFFDPKTKYIWSLALDAKGNLYIATGDRGEIFRVNPAGEGAVFFKSDESHIRTLTFDRQDGLIAGSDGSGLVYRISPAGEGFVLYSAPKKEITALAVDDAGNIYAAGVGEKRSTGAAAGPAFNPPPPPPGAAAAPAPNVNPLASTGGSEIYMIAPDGSPRRLFAAKEEIVYALAFDPRGRLLAGSGNKGRVLAIEKNGDFTDLVKASATQVTGFASAGTRGLYVSTSNLGKVFLLGAAPQAEGTFESEVFDARVFSRWGRMEVRGGGRYDLFARSGNVDNPDRNWSPWKKVMLQKEEKDSRLDAPPARFVQWRAVLAAGAAADSDRSSNPATDIESVKVYYRARNVAPVIEEIAVQPGARFAQSSVARGSSGGETVTVNFASAAPAPAAPGAARADGPMAAQRDRASIAVRWAAHDDNDDELLYSLYYRGDGETRWKLLKDKIADKFYSWDAGLLPDGGYTVRVAANDSPSHTPDEALSDSRESARFEVDTTAPRIESLSAKVEAGQLHVSFTAADQFSNIQRAEFSIDAGEWQFVEPVGQLSDSKIETYDFNAPLPATADAATAGKDAASRETASRDSKKKKSRAAPAADETPAGDAVPLSQEHVVVVRVYDRYDNAGTAKSVAH